MEQAIVDFSYHQKSLEHIALWSSGLPANDNGLVYEEDWMLLNLLLTEIITLDEDNEPNPEV
jgi:hypothetical protein